jgi:NADP-dependent 3-hydroxy acid dehydrogenase YdfG
MTFGDDRIRALLPLRPFAGPLWRGRWSATYQISDYLDRGARIAAVCYGEEDMGDRVKEKVALVSGAGSSGPGWGNGKAAAVLFAREGAKVLAADINLDAAVETKRIIEGEGGICEAVAGNVSRADDVAAMVDACIATFGRIDVLHNNVGIVEVGGPVETTEESWDRVNDVNLKR